MTRLILFIVSMVCLYESFSFALIYDTNSPQYQKFLVGGQPLQQTKAAKGGKRESNPRSGRPGGRSADHRHR